MMRTALLAAFAAMLLLQGCNTTLTKGSDRRSDGIYIEDGTIESTALQRIDKKYQNKVRVEINSYNRKVLITGEVPDEAVKADMFRIVGTVQNVTDIYNEVRIGFQASFSDRSNDDLIAGNIRLRLRNTDKDFFRADRVKVVVSHNICYLMGLVTHAEATVAIDVARTSNAVNKVVPYFEFID